MLIAYYGRDEDILTKLTTEILLYLQLPLDNGGLKYNNTDARSSKCVQKPSAHEKHGTQSRILLATTMSWASVIGCRLHFQLDKRLETYETSHKRDFVYRPISSTPVLRPKTSKIYRNYALGHPVGTTAYSEEFCWRPVAKSDCIRSATASGYRRNNPHPSQAFMVWGYSTDQLKSLADSSSPYSRQLTEQDVQKALSAQYRSTYRVDFLGLPQGIIKNRIIHAPSIRSHPDHYDTQTEMRHNYWQPILKPELLGNNSRYGCNKLHGVAVRGIVPTLFHSDINNQRICKQQTTYNTHFGSQHADVSVLNSKQFCKQPASEKGIKDVKTLMQIASSSAHEWRVKKQEILPQAPRTLERMSAWPGPL
ncbi:testis-expressed protein 26 [Paramisgurnus dabryanus]|uniref:testis-expressed protein 26 n=1 Tax=Paramisgurnus dabryanus TaxID=90735 RepID=UPI0031F45762